MNQKGGNQLLSPLSNGQAKNNTVSEVLTV